ncbi:MAG: O-Antigen ligase [Parcubacteria group bacterium ADurb.Bin326]|nr:MAG: O-Antigen ligase [Parcubacteria group bacterium ADurb.Bin326]
MTIVVIRSIREKDCASIKTFASASLVGIFLFFAFSSFVIARSDFSSRLEQRSLDERGSQIIESLGIFRSSNWLGVGINNYTATLASLNPALPAYSLQPAHNLYLLILAELGIVGFLTFIFFIIFFLLQKKARHGQLVWLAPLLIIGLFDHYLWTQYVGIVLFWLILTKIEQSAKIVRYPSFSKNINPKPN